MLIESEIKKLKIEMRQELQQLRKLIATRLVADKWVPQSTACALLNVKPRQLTNIRVHVNKQGVKAGSIAWKKGKGKTVLYYMPDIEKYRGGTIIMN